MVLHDRSNPFAGSIVLAAVLVTGPGSATKAPGTRPRTTAGSSATRTAR
jgi:hypothetical protein